jgi:multidrug resistance protein
VNGTAMTRKHLFVLLACLFVVMVGFGITLPVLPFYVERLPLTGGASRQSVAMHVGLLTGVYALAQLFFAPLWGKWSDRTGRRPLLLAGIAGYAVGQVLFGLATTMWLLYAARILGGILSSATLPVSAAYVADMTTEEGRGRGMAWLGTATSLGFVVGPALGGVLSRRDLHFSVRCWHLLIDSFSIPFFVAAILGGLTFLAAMQWLPESLSAHAVTQPNGGTKKDWRALVQSLGPLLGLSLAGQFALATFAGTFALYAQAKFNSGPVEVGTAFMICGLVMSVFQIGAAELLGGRIKEIHRVEVGFGLMGASLVFLVVARTMPLAFALVALIALGTALISPNLATLISNRSGNRGVGEALGAQNAANSLAQASGPALGGALFAWWMSAPYLLTGALSVAVALVIGWNVRRGRRAEGFTA